MLMTGAPAWLGAELASTVGIFSLCAHLNLWWNGRKKEKERRKRVLDAYRKWNSLCIDMNVVHYKLPGAFRVVRDCCRRRSIIHGQQLKTLGLFKRNRHIFGRGSVGGDPKSHDSLFLRWRPGGGQQTHAALTNVTEDTKKRISVHPDQRFLSHLLQLVS
jgi:hypothetical protein